jgi:hypothetical protein
MATNSLRVAIVDDQGELDASCHEIRTRLEENEDMPVTIFWFDSEKLYVQNDDTQESVFDPGHVIDEIAEAKPDVILLDIVLREREGHHDLDMSDWLLHELCKDDRLDGAVILIISQYFDTHCVVSSSWLPWTFSKLRLREDVSVWRQFVGLMANLERVAILQAGVKRMAKVRVFAPKHPQVPESILRDTTGSVGDLE